MKRINRDLKEEIRDYWSKRSETFDLAFGHAIAAGPEFDAWAAAVKQALGPQPRRILELACGTGEVTGVLLGLGHEVTALDFSEAMLTVARRKHAGHKKARFILADAENTMEDEASYDAVVCRHLVWTLTEPEQAFSDWQRILRPGGLLLIFDGDWARPTLVGRAASLIIRMIDLVVSADPHHGGMSSDRHAAIMAQLPFGGGLTTKRLVPMLAEAGFVDIELSSQRTIAAAQRKHATLRNKLRTLTYRRFVLSCEASRRDHGW